MEITQECSKMMVWKIFVIFELYVGALSTQSQKCRFFKMQPFWVTHALPYIENKHWRSFKNSILETSFFSFCMKTISTCTKTDHLAESTYKRYSLEIYEHYYGLYSYGQTWASCFCFLHFIWNWEKWIKR